MPGLPQLPRRRSTRADTEAIFYVSTSFVSLHDSTLFCERKIATLCRISFACRTRCLSAEYRLGPERPSMTLQNVTTNPLFTIGHSNHEAADFLAVLINHGVSTLCDVRSRPGSFRFPQFNREPLKAILVSAGLRYEFLGEALGGRPADPRVYHRDGHVDYLARRKSAEFAAGIDRLLELCRAGSTVLMCAEEDPLQCHRFLMISPALLERGVVPSHVRRGGVLESQRDAEDRLLELHGRTAFATGSLFVSERESAIEEALLLQAREFAFRASPESIENF